VDLRAEVYSLGCTLFFLLAGRPPFHAEALAQLLLKHQPEPTPAVRAIRPEGPAALLAGVRAGREAASNPGTPEGVHAQQRLGPVHPAQAVGSVWETGKGFVADRQLFRA
jgi:serine/threonine protein kinase